MKASVSRDENCILIIRHLTALVSTGFALPAFLPSVIFVVFSFVTKNNIDNMVKSDKNYDVSCKRHTACLFIPPFGKILSKQ